MMYSVFESFEDNAAQEWHLPPACPMAQSRSLVPISLENPVLAFLKTYQIFLFWKATLSLSSRSLGEGVGDVHAALEGVLELV